MPIYFDKETEKAIIEYNKTDDHTVRNQIYKEKIEYAFNKLVENIINSFKLISRSENNRTLIDKTVGDLVIKLNKFDPERKSKFGKKAKAFSFFGTVAKNFIMLEWKKEGKMSHIHDFEEFNEEDNKGTNSALILEKFCIRDEEQERNEFKDVILLFLRSEQDRANMAIDEKILDAIEFAFLHQYDITNKKALFLFLREFTGLTTPEISSFLSRFRPKLRKHIANYLKGEF